MIKIQVHPNTPPMSWNAFCVATPTFAVALDGYVCEGPKFDPTGPLVLASVGPRANFNHHEGVDRLATRATCAQVHLAIRQGFFSCFRDESGPRAEVYVNDCDQDVSLSWYLIKNHFRAEHAMNPLLNRLVDMEDKLDATAGAYPYPVDLPCLQELAWVFEPYTQVRRVGGLDDRDSQTFAMVIEQVCARIDAHLLGRGGSTPLDTRYERLGTVGPAALVREVGPQARTAMFAEGIRAFVSVRERQDGRWAYVLGRMSQYVPFDLPRACERLNEVEGLVESADRWGGCDNVIGSPRIAGSRLSPERLSEVVTA